MRAAAQGHFDICKLFLEAGAKIDQQDIVSSQFIYLRQLMWQKTYMWRS